MDHVVSFPCRHDLTCEERVWGHWSIFFVSCTITHTVRNPIFVEVDANRHVIVELTEPIKNQRQSHIHVLDSFRCWGWGWVLGMRLYRTCVCCTDRGSAATHIQWADCGNVRRNSLWTSDVTSLFNACASITEQDGKRFESMFSHRFEVFQPKNKDKTRHNTIELCYNGQPGGRELVVVIERRLFWR